MPTAAIVARQIAIAPDKVEVEFQGATTWGLPDRVTREALDGGSVVVVGTDFELCIATSSLPNLCRDGYVRVGTTEEGSAATGQRYRVRDLRTENDGLETVLWLADAD